MSILKTVTFLFLALAGLACTSVFFVSHAQSKREEPLIVYYSAPDNPGDNRSDYYVALLELALDKSGATFKLKPVHLDESVLRTNQLIEFNQKINVIWLPTSPELEQSLNPIEIPIDKGILGWRIFLINKKSQAAFFDIHTIDQLRKFSAGQERGWGDEAILRSNGLKVVEGWKYENLFPMLAADRFQYFPRGIGEIWNEQTRYGYLGLEVEQTLALHYPATTYFFVSKANKKLHDLIERGLKKTIADGSFEKLFNGYYGEIFKRARIDKRTVFELNNPWKPAH